MNAFKLFEDGENKPTCLKDEVLENHKNTKFKYLLDADPMSNSSIAVM